MLIEILPYDFMQRAIMVAIAISIFAPILRIFLILCHQGLMNDTLSHVSLAGAALSILFGALTTWSTILVVMTATVILEYLQTVYEHYVETSTATSVSLGLAISLIVVSKSENGSSVSLDQYLFGSITTISTGQVVALFTTAIVVVLLTILFIRPMHTSIFDEETAFVNGLPVRLMFVLFNIVTGIAIALTIPTAGTLLVPMIMVLSASIATHLGKNFKLVILIGVIVDFIGMVVDIITSYYWEALASATITVVFVGIFPLVNLFNMIFHHNS